MPLIEQLCVLLLVCLSTSTIFSMNISEPETTSSSNITNRSGRAAAPARPPSRPGRPVQGSVNTGVEIPTSSE